MDCLLLADDLTGAADAGAKFVAQGCSGTVLLAWNGDAAACDVDVLAINTDTRRVNESGARRRLRETARRIAADAAPAMVFKKIDSTLRGHIGAELDEALAAFACTHAIVAPSFPAMGRTVRDGLLFVATSDVGTAADGANAPHEHAPRDITALLTAQGIRPATLARVGIAGMSRAEGAAPDAVATPVSLDDAVRRGARVWVCDAESQADLDTLVSTVIDAMRAMGGRPLWVGSAGLAQALAAYLASHRAGIRQRSPLFPQPGESTLPPTRSVLLCIGSPHAVTREQLTHLLHARDVALASDATALRDAIACGRHVLVTIDSSPSTPSTPPLPNDRLDTAEQPQARDVHHLLQAATEAPTRGALAGVIMSGGDTAADICRALNADRLQLGGEVANGIPWGVLRGGPADSLPLVLKSGGFGAPDALIAAVDFLQTLTLPHAAHDAPAVSDISHARS